jgi:integrase/recombinase XerD
VRYHRSLRTFRTYRPILDSFKAFCPKTYVDEVERQDLLDFATDCLKQGQKGKSIYNKLVVISQVMKQHGKAKLLNAPTGLASSKPCGRSMKISNSRSFSRLHARGSALQVLSHVRIPRCGRALRHLARCGFQAHGGSRDRETALGISSEELGGEGGPGSRRSSVTMLQKFRPANATPDDPLFPSATGRPDGAMLEKLKAVAYRGKLNCGHCAVSHKLENGTVKINRCAEGAYCGRWFLHKFRHTYATRHLQDGIDIRTLQQWMGHRDIASTMVYLKGVRNSDVQARINKGSLAAFA